MMQLGMQNMVSCFFTGDINSLLYHEKARLVAGGLMVASIYFIKKHDSFSSISPSHPIINQLGFSYNYIKTSLRTVHLCFCINMPSSVRKIHYIRSEVLIWVFLLFVLPRYHSSRSSYEPRKEHSCRAWEGDGDRWSSNCVGLGSLVCCVLFWLVCVCVCVCVGVWVVVLCGTVFCEWSRCRMSACTSLVSSNPHPFLCPTTLLFLVAHSCSDLVQQVIKKQHIIYSWSLQRFWLSTYFLCRLLEEPNEQLHFNQNKCCDNHVAKQCVQKCQHVWLSLRHHQLLEWMPQCWHQCLHLLCFWKFNLLSWQSGLLNWNSVSIILFSHTVHCNT